ncbi:DUF1093 domain-containing protein, partial [Staphylococcus aureus]
TKDGKSKKIEYTASKKLKQNHYLVVREKSHTIHSLQLSSLQLSLSEDCLD